MIAFLIPFSNEICANNTLIIHVTTVLLRDVFA